MTIRKDAARLDRTKTIAAIRAGLRDVDAGRTKPARAVLKLLAKKYGLRQSGG